MIENYCALLTSRNNFFFFYSTSTSTGRVRINWREFIGKMLRWQSERSRDTTRARYIEGLREVAVSRPLGLRDSLRAVYSDRERTEHCVEAGGCWLWHRRKPSIFLRRQKLPSRIVRGTIGVSKTQFVPFSARVDCYQREKRKVHLGPAEIPMYSRCTPALGRWFREAGFTWKSIEFRHGETREIRDWNGFFFGVNVWLWKNSTLPGKIRYRPQEPSGSPNNHQIICKIGLLHHIHFFFFFQLV